MPVVVDACALAELLLRTDRAPAVTQAIGGEEMTAPDLVNVEVLSTLRNLERGGKLSEERASQAVADLLSAPLRRLPTIALLEPAWDLRGNVSPYDACYLALAARLGCALVSGDLRLKRAAGPVPVILV